MRQSESGAERVAHYLSESGRKNVAIAQSEPLGHKVSEFESESCEGNVPQ